MMQQTGNLRLRLMTYNVGGGRKDLATDPACLLEVIRDASPDILVAQEVTDYQDAEGKWFSTIDQIAQAGDFGDNCYFGPTLTMKHDMHVRRAIMVEGLFKDWQDWRHGNALYCRQGFVQLSDTSKPGIPRSIPLFRPAVYRGSRDTDPRYVLLARANLAPVFPFVAGVHLTTMIGERGVHEIPGRAERAQMRRFGQARRLLDLLREHVLKKGEVVFLLGDFNAPSSEPCIASVLEREGGFVHLQPKNGRAPTHPKVPDAVDHILVYPRDRLLDYECRIVNTTVASNASDHLPVVADVVIR